MYLRSLVYPMGCDTSIVLRLSMLRGVGGIMIRNIECDFIFGNSRISRESIEYSVLHDWTEHGRLCTCLVPRCFDIWSTRGLVNRI